MTVEYIGQANKDPNNVLRQCEDEYQALFVLGFNKEDNMEFHCTHNLTNTQVLWLIENFKAHYLLQMDDDD